jgi:hypothetical protein
MKFFVAFYFEDKGLCAELVEAPSKDAALRQFFDTHATEYSPDNEGFGYFLDDFNDKETPMGKVICHSVLDTESCGRE